MILPAPISGQTGRTSRNFSVNQPGCDPGMGQVSRHRFGDGASSRLQHALRTTKWDAPLEMRMKWLTETCQTHPLRSMLELED